MNFRKGFTLIELLVVIAIIGILAGIVLASLGLAKTKANDSAVKGTLHNIRNAAAEEYYVTNGYSYGAAGTTAGSCAGPAAGSAMWTDTNSGMSNLLSGVTKLSGAGNVDCGTSVSAWSVAASLPGGGYWCVDSIGAARNVSSTTGVAYTGLTGSNSLTTAHFNAGTTNCN